MSYDYLYFITILHLIYLILLSFIKVDLNIPNLHR
jgi:hypothetical protein